MKSNVFLSAVLVTVSALLASCGSGHIEGNPAPLPAAHGRDVPGDGSWRLQYQSSCVNGAIEKCRGAYGFSVYGDGTYEVGPGPDHQMVYGHLDADELHSFQQVLGKIHTADFSIESRAPEKCLQAAVGPADLIQLSYREANHGIVHVAGADVCFDPSFVSTPQDAAAIQTWLSGLVSKYYPDSFPNPCVNAASAIQNSYPDLQRCQQDSDCAYLDLNFLPTDRANIPVFLDDCSYIRTLPVANAFAVVSSQRELLLQRELAKKVCGTQVKRPTCSQALQFDSGAAPPVCVQGVCQINPTLGRI